MAVSFEYMWITIPLLLIPIMYGIVIMFLTRVWMFSAPTRKRPIPNYSLHVMRDLRESSPADEKYAPTLPYAAPRSVSRSRFATPVGSGRATPQMQFHHYQAAAAMVRNIRSGPSSGRTTPLYSSASQRPL